MEGKNKSKRIIIRILKILGWFVASIILLLIALALIIQVPSVQNKLVQRATSFLEEKIGTEVSLGRILISFPKTIVLEDLYLEDQKKDTLLYAGRLELNTDLFALAKREIQLNEIALKNCRAYIDRPENDSSYNFSYILKAFAGDSTATPDTLEQSGWKFSIGQIAFEHIRSRYHDYLTGNLVDLRLGNFMVSISDFDLDKMRVIVDEIRLADTDVSFVQTKQPEVTEEVAEEKNPLTYDVGVATIDLSNVRGVFEQRALGQYIRLDLGKSVLKTDKIDLKTNRIDLASFTLKNSFLSIHQRSVAQQASAQYDPEPAAEKQAETARPWTIALNDLDLSENSIQLYDFTKPATAGLDFSHLWFHDLALQAKDILIFGSEFKATFENLALRDKSGFTINGLRGGVAITEKQSEVNELTVHTPNSTIRLDVTATYPSLQRIAQEYSRAKFNASFDRTTIGLKDLLYFKPSLKDSLPTGLPANSKLAINGRLRGSLGDVSISNLSVRGLGDTYLLAQGRIKGLPDANKLYLDLEVDKLRTTRVDLQRILPDTLIPESIELPQWIELTATYKGSLKKSEFITKLTSSFGSASLEGKADLDTLSPSRGIDARLAVNEFDLGQLLKQPDTIGKVSFHADAKLTGLSPEEITGTVKATLEGFDYREYHYQDLVIDGRMDHGVYAGTVSMRDRNLDFLLRGDLDFSEDIPRYKVTFDLRNADFKALHLAERPLKAKGMMIANMATKDFRSLNGNFGLRKVAIFNGDALYAVDSLLFASIDQVGRSELKIDSDLLQGSFEGTFNIFEMPDVLREYFSTYYTLHDTTLEARKDAGPQKFDFKLKLKKTELLTDILLPELESFVPGEITGSFDSEAKRLDMSIGIDDIRYSKIGVKSFKLVTTSDAEALRYEIEADKIFVDSLKIDGLAFDGVVANDSIRTRLTVLDSADRAKYSIAGIFHSLESEYEFNFLPNGVKLNYVDWTVPANNYLRFGGKRIFARDIMLVNGNEKIIIDSQNDAVGTLFVGFRELNLEYLVSMVAKEKAASGLLHGDIYIVPDTANMTFTASIGIRDFNISEIPWGDVSLSVARKTAEKFEVDFGIVSDRNQLKANGFYVTGESPSMDITARISRFDLHTLEPVTMGQLKDFAGTLTGNIHVQGSPQKPDVDGNINLRDVKFFSTYLNSAFAINRETITLNDRGIGFDSFELLDGRKNKAVLNGSIATNNYRDFAFFLDLTSSNFRLLNTTEDDNELFYGRVDVNATAKIRGTADQPVIDVQLSLGDNSTFTYVVPQSEAGVMEQQGIVRFVDKTFKNDPFMKKINVADTVKSQFTGLYLTARIELTDKESFTVVIDPTTGDQLTVKGNTTLVLSMDPTGDMDLSGRYEISEGTYNLSFYKFLKREFKMEKGSTMTWSGDPLNAKMDISAIYEVETAPIDLLSNQLNGDELNQYKQRLPFYVYLDIKGELLKPDISFRLDMPMSERNFGNGNVYSRIQDINTRESDLNKQVFALLILKRFISDNPFENQGATGFEGTARSSVSKILTEQLNRLSQNVRGVELSFDVKSYEDYSSGSAQGQTQLQLGLSKNFFNDRLVVKVSGNVGIEGQNTQQEATDYIGDLALEYRLTEDGRFRITGFRNSNYDMIDGELTETGAGLIYIKDYNLLNELLKPNARRKK